MVKNSTQFRQRFNRWKNGAKVYDAGKPISDDEYYSTMENVAKENWEKWEDVSEDAALTRILNANDYDYRGYYNKYPKSKANADTHWTDEFKTVYHPTFSEESIYSGKKSKFNPDGLKGGSWGENDKFYPQNWQMFGTKYKSLNPIPKYDTGDAPSELPNSSKALGNLLYRTASFIPQTRAITNIMDILGVSPDDEVFGASDGTDILGTTGLLLNRTKKTPINNGTIAKQYAEYYNKKLAKIIKPLSAIDIIGDAYQWVQDAKALEAAMREEAPNGVWKSGIKIDPILHGY